MIGNRGKWLLRRPTGDAPTRLFLLPYSGVGASMYSRWPARFGDVEVCLVQPPGRENRIREAHYGTYDALAERAAAGLAPNLDRPYGLFGHCGGALAAFALARGIAAAGHRLPDCLFLSSQVAPHDGPFGRFLDMSDAELTTELEQLTVAMGGMPTPDAITMGLDVLKADVAANRAYRLSPPEPVDADLHAIGWDADREIRPEQMTGWARWAGDGRYFPTVLSGDHHAFIRAPEQLLRTFDDGLSRVAASREVS